ncbi:hypothetical protein FFI94_003270 [Rhodococcus sp. KBS0724]|uniref:hypothetical protein n=1 Tax=Rhodococcus sp. KBS0724 TaxID=1179674 RepID=UPI00110E6B2D|nr:hypothetical protein [Rhodococcus sp. KBS0724]TSD45270.1 hypothetical protein FFI94_003270 [Rhodococcus sp. KBS0724]
MAIDNLVLSQPEWRFSRCDRPVVAEVGREVTRRMSECRDAHAPSDGASVDAKSGDRAGLFREPVHMMDHRLRLAL